jgi:putative flippase GtrA
MIGGGPGAALRRWLKFNFVGAIGMGVQLALLTVLTKVAHLDYLVATAIAVECAVLHNFVGHERFTWSDRASVGDRQLALRLLKFNGTTGAISIAGNLLLMRVFVAQVHLPAPLASFGAIAMCSVANFLANHCFVFHSHAAEDAARFRLARGRPAQRQLAAQGDLRG